MLIYLSLLDSEEEISKFELIYSTYKKQMYYTANNILKDSHLAEDAVHNAFLRIINNLEKIEDINSHKTDNEISEILDIKPDNVRKRISRGREKLKNILKKMEVYSIG